MKKYIYHIIAILAFLMPKNILAQTDNYEPYAVLSEGNTVLTFYYDDQKEARGGFTYGPFDLGFSSSEWNKRKNIVKVVFNDSFANCTSIYNTARWFNGFENLTTIYGLRNLNTTSVTDMSFMFSECSKLTSLDVSNFDTGNVTDMSFMFFGCSGLESINVAKLKTDSVTNMHAMFRECSGLTGIDVSNFITTNVTDMGEMFYECSSLTTLDLGNFNTQKVTNTGLMFSGCTVLTSLNVSSFDTRNVTSMSGMFQLCKSLSSLDVSGFDTGKVTNMGYMFSQCNSLEALDVSGFNTANVTNMECMFQLCSCLKNLNVRGFNTSNVTVMTGLFSQCTNLASIDVSNFKTDKVTGMGGMFQKCSNLTELNLKNFNTGNVTSMDRFFMYCSNLKSLDLSSFNTEKVTNMLYMFTGCSNLSTIYASSDWNTSLVILGDDMFSGCTNLAGGNGTLFDNSHTDYTYAHIDGDSNGPGYFTRGTHTLSIVVNGDGYVIYNNGLIRNSNRVTTLKDGTSVSIQIVPDKGAQIKSLIVNDKEETLNISNNQYTISSLSKTTSIKVEFETIESISNDGIRYNVVSANDGTVKLAEIEDKLCINVPASFTAYDLEWKVIGIEENALTNNVTELAAIIWNPEYQFNERPSNPNLLLYVKSEEYAPSDSMNVVVDDKAKNITLKDGSTAHNFYCPKAFVAEQINYVHNYSMKSGFNTCQGWESIVLPFDVATVTSKTGSQLVPYSLWKYGDNTRPFWLYSMNEDGWKSESAIKANIPYVISMPNNENYNATYNQSGDIEFSASNVEVKASDELANSKWGHLLFVPNYQHQKSSSDIYALNVNNSIYTYTETDPVEGSAFIRELRDVGPFEAYMMIEGNVSATRSVSIFGDDETTGIMDLPMSSDYNGNNKVYSLSGRLIKQGKDDKDLQNLPKGVYIINGKKVIK